MSILSNVELKSIEIGTIKISFDSKKIKFKQESYTSILQKYNNFCYTNLEIPKETKEDWDVVPNKESLPVNVPESIVVHIENKTYEKKESKLPKIKDRIYMLKIEGRLLPQLEGKRALKIKDSMKNNMKLNNFQAMCESKEETNVAISDEKEQDAIETSVSEKIKITKNESANAKIKKYSDISENNSDDNKNTPLMMKAKPVADIIKEAKIATDKFKLMNDESQSPIAIPPTVIEEHVAIPVTDDNEKKSKIKNIVSSEQLKEYMEKAEQLKADLDRARKNAEIAKADAEKAKEKAVAEKKEAEAAQERLIETIEKLEKHNQELEKEKFAREEEARKYSEQSQEYIAQEKEYSTMQEEYKNTINEMLAVIG